MAAQDYLGMFGLAGEEAARAAALRAKQQQAMTLAQMDPRAQVNYGAIRGGQMLGEGLGDAIRTGVGAATGADTRTAAEVARAVREQLAAANVDPSDPDKFYPVLIDTLRKNGMLPQAVVAAREYEEIRNKRRDDERAQKKDDAAAADRTARTELLRRGTPLAQNIEALGKLYALRDAEPDPAKRKAIEQRIQIMEDAISKRNIQIRDGGNSLDVFVNGEYVSSTPKGIDPTAKYKADHPNPHVGAGAGAGGEGLSKVGLTEDRTKAVFKGNKSGRLYVHDANGNPVPFTGNYLPTETGEEAKSRVLGGRMSAASDAIDNLPSMLGATRAKLYFSLDKDPIKQSALAATFTDADKRYVNAVRSFLNANLRYDSGAAVPESEYPKYMDDLIPFDGDSPTLMDQKATNRANSARLIVRGPAGGAKPAAGNGLPPGVKVRVKG